MNNLVAFAHALADDTRLRLVHLLLDEALCVCELADVLEMPQSSVSSHLQVVRKAGMLESEKRGKWVYYRVEPGFRLLVASLDKFFSLSPATDHVLQSDARNAVKRLSQREQSSCPPPLELASRSKNPCC